MIKLIKKHILKIIPKNILNIYGINKIFLNKYGYVKTIQLKLPINKNDEPIPWYTYPAIEYLNQLDLKDKAIFEYGTGNSSLFFAKKSKNVTSVEDNKEWFDKIIKNKPDNLNVIYQKDKNDYLSSITKLDKKFDIIVIDANYRLECCSYVKLFLEDDGLVILDNSERDQDCAKYLRDNLDLIEIDFFGIGPINNYAWTTSIFFSRKVVLKTVSDTQPTIPLGGLCLKNENANN